MGAVVTTDHGGLDKLVYRDDVPVSEPANGEVLIAVGACSLNNTDINTRTGWYAPSVRGATEVDALLTEVAPWNRTTLVFPRIQGADIAGRIVAAGEDVPATRRSSVEPGGPESNATLARRRPRCQGAWPHPAADWRRPGLEARSRTVGPTGADGTLRRTTDRTVSLPVSSLCTSPSGSGRMTTASRSPRTAPHRSPRPVAAPSVGRGVCTIAYR